MLNVMLLDNDEDNQYVHLELMSYDEEIGVNCVTSFDKLADALVESEKLGISYDAFVLGYGPPQEIEQALEIISSLTAPTDGKPQPRIIFSSCFSEDFSLLLAQEAKEKCGTEQIVILYRPHGIEELKDLIKKEDLSEILENQEDKAKTLRARLQGKAGRSLRDYLDTERAAITRSHAVLG